VRSRNSKGKFAWLVALLVLAPALVHAEIPSHLGGGIGPDGRPIAPGASQAKFFQLVNACAAGRGPSGLGIGAGAGVNAPPSVAAPDLNAGLFQVPAVVAAGPSGLESLSAGGAGGDANRGNQIFQARCLSCHGPGRPQAGLAASGPNGAARVVSATNPMPPPPAALSAQEKADLVAFLNQRNGVR
jgi:mono/diheme cytochrome c family protein